MVEKDLKKKGRGAYEYKLDENSNMIAVRWFDNKSANLVSSYADIEPVGNVRRYDRSLKEHIIVQQSYIVKVYNEYMGGIDKLDMMCALYKPRLRTRWYIYIWLHTVFIASVNAWLLYRRNLKVMQPDKQFMQFKRFLADIAGSLVNTAKRPVGRPSLDAVEPPTKSWRVQGCPTVSKTTILEGLKDNYIENCCVFSFSRRNF